MRLATITIAGIVFMAMQGDTRAVQNVLDPEVATGEQTNTIPAPQDDPVMLAASGPLCGGSRPIIYQNSAGSLHYRWCDAGNRVAYTDVYQSVGGTLYYIQSTQLRCPNPPAPVRRVVCS